MAGEFSGFSPYDDPDKDKASQEGGGDFPPPPFQAQSPYGMPPSGQPPMYGQPPYGMPPYGMPPIGGMYDPQMMMYGMYGQFRVYEWQEAWWLAISKPDDYNYWQLAADPQATLSRGIIWLGIALFFSLILNAISQFLWYVAVGLDPLFPQTTPGTTTTTFGGGEIFLTLLCSPFIVGFGLVIYLIYVGVIHLAASLFGGKGSYEKMFYMFSIIVAPLTIINGFLGFIPIFGSLVGFVVILYGLVIMGIAAKIIYQMDMMRGCLAVGAPFLIVFGCWFSCFFFIVLSAL